MKASSAVSLRQLLDELEETRIRLGLEGVRGLLEALGSPQQRLPHVLIAGTNGKGSTAAFLNSMLVAAGYRTGLYTSPHLESVRERIRVDGVALVADEFERRLRRVLTASEEDSGGWPTYFEALTALAFDHFERVCDLAVMEVGLGGRLDATNTGRPMLSVVTEIALDHVAMLGPTEREIAIEKAGVMRAGKVTLGWVSSASAQQALEARAVEVDSRWLDARAGTRVKAAGEGAVSVTTPEGAYELRSSLPGEHQASNLALAVRAAEVLAADGWPAITREAIIAGAQNCRWPGRLESVRVGNSDVLLDAAHNPQGARALDAHLRSAGKPYTLLFGALREKDVAAVLPVVAARARSVVLTAPDSPRAIEPSELAALVPAVEPICVTNAASALETALECPATQIVVCGSIYLVGEVRRLLTERFGKPEPAASSSISPPGVGPQFA